MPKLLGYDKNNLLSFPSLNDLWETWLDQDITRNSSPNFNNLYIDQNVGIGTNNPAYNLDVNGDLNFTGTIYQNGQPFSGDKWSVANVDDIYYSIGNVGIGTNNPAYDLDVGGNINYTSNLSKNGVVLGEWVKNTLDNNIYYTDAFVGIGTNNPAYNLDVDGDFNFSGDIYQNGQLFTGSQWITTNTTELYYNTGNVGVGTTNPNYTLDVLGDINYTANLSKNGVVLGEWVKNTLDNNIYYTDAFVGIGTNNPAYNLDVDGDFNFSGDIYQNGQLFTGSQWITTNTTELYYNTGNVGVGTTNPNYTLDILGDINYTANLSKNGVVLGEWVKNTLDNNIYYNDAFVGIGTTNPEAPLHVNDYEMILTPKLNSDGTTFLIKSRNNSKGLEIGVNDDIGNGHTYINTINSKDLTFSTNSNQAIRIDGITSQTFFQFQLNTDSGIYCSVNTKDNKKLVLYDTEITPNQNQFYGFGIDTVSDDLRYQISSQSVSHVFYSGIDSTTSQELLRIQGDGNIGIGTTLPQSKLHLFNDNTSSNLIITGESNTLSTKESGIFFQNDEQPNLNRYKTKILSVGDGSFGQSDLYFALNDDNDNTSAGIIDTKMAIMRTGRVGIGTTNPQSITHIYSNDDPTNLIITSQSTPSNPTQSGIFFQNDQSPNFNRYKTKILAVGDGTFGQSDLFFALNNSNNSISANLNDTKMVIKRDGNVGIGTTVPNYTLDVNGDINYTGDLYQNGVLFSGASQWITTNITEIYYNLGDVGIGTTDPNYRLDVNGDINYTGELSKDGVVIGEWLKTNDDKIYYPTKNVAVGMPNPTDNFVVNDDTLLGGTLTTSSYREQKNRVQTQLFLTLNTTFLHLSTNYSGQYVLIVSDAEDEIYQSNNYGKSFTLLTIGNNIAKTTMDYTGQYRALYDITSSTVHTIYFSSDYGASYTSVFVINGVSLDYLDMQMSGDGKTLIVITYEYDGLGSTIINKGVNFGASFTPITPIINNFAYAKVSYDGTYILIGYDLDALYISSDSGITFNPAGPILNTITPGFAYRLAMSGDGKHIYASPNNKLYYSSDYGQNFIQIDSSFDCYYYVSCSHSGKYVAYGSIPNTRYSSNYGESFIDINTAFSPTPADYVEVVKNGSAFYYIANDTPNLSNDLYISSTGIQPIGAILDVDGDINFTGNLFQNGSAFFTSSQWLTNASDIFYNTGNVGIGTNTPMDRLHLSNLSGSSNLIISGNTSTLVERQSGIFFQNDDQPNLSRYKTKILAVGNGFFGQSDLYFALNNQNNGNSASLSDTRMVILRTGNVGIGTTNPGYKLDVNGDINFSGNLFQNGTPFGGTTQWVNDIIPNGISYSLGNVGIGTVSNGTDKLLVDGNINTLGEYQKSGNNIVSVDNSLVISGIAPINNFVMTPTITNLNPRYHKLYQIDNSSVFSCVFLIPPNNLSSNSSQSSFEFDLPYAPIFSNIYDATFSISGYIDETPIINIENCVAYCKTGTSKCIISFTSGIDVTLYNHILQVVVYY
jgi:hypothetical protein